MDFGVPMLVFALSSSRLPLYVLPLFVPIWLLAAARIEALNLDCSRHALVLALGWAAIRIGLRASIT